MRISIALCTYNGELYLQEQLRSILEQSRLPDEVVICDDCSTDTTWTILENFKSKASFEVRLIKNHSNLGSTANFAKAIDSCSGDIIFLADQDDIWLPQKIEIMAEIFENDPDVGMAFSDAYVTNDLLQPYPRSLWQYIGFDNNIRGLCEKGRFWEVLANESYVTGATMAFHSKWKLLLYPFPGDWIHDEWITFLTSLFSQVRAVPDKLIMYRKHSNQQIGVKIKSTFVRLRLCVFPDQNRRRYKRYIDRMDNLLRRIIDFKEHLREPQMYEELIKRLEHWKIRYMLPKNPWKRWCAIRRELAAGCYRKYSKSNRMALKDFFD